MPTYHYRCRDCDHDFEIQQSFSDDALEECPECDDGRLKKVYGSVGIAFKGSGFYKNDARSGSTSSSKSSSTAGGSSGDSSSNDSSSDSSSTSKDKPAKEKASSSSSSSSGSSSSSD